MLLEYGVMRGVNYKCRGGMQPNQVPVAYSIVDFVSPKIHYFITDEIE